MRGNGRDREGQGDVEDLLSVRQNELGASEWQEVDPALDVDATLRIAYQAERDFDRVTGVRAGDEALIARAADRALAGRRAPAARRRADRRVALALGLVPVMFASAAGAWWAVRSARPPTDAPVPAARAPRARAGAGPRGTAPDVAPPPTEAAPVAAPGSVPPPVPVAAPAPTPDLVSVPARRSQSRPAPAPSPTPAAYPELAPSRPTVAPALATAPAARPAPLAATAAELFRRANGARHAGDAAWAHALYREVEDRFPGSAEARLARVSLGKLLLGAGDARAAEAEFALYLSGGGGPLVQEALVGQAESLLRLARPDDERRVWQRLVEEFPACVYAPQARRRLAELGAPDPAPTPVP